MKLEWVAKSVSRLLISHACYGKMLMNGPSLILFSPDYVETAFLSDETLDYREKWNYVTNNG